MCRIHNNRKKPNQILSSDWNKPIWKEKKLVEQTQVIVLSLNSNSSIATPIDLVTNSMHSMHLWNREFQRALLECRTITEVTRTAAAKFRWYSGVSSYLITYTVYRLWSCTCLYLFFLLLRSYIRVRLFLVLYL